MRLILTEQNPNWKLPERRVAKYLKRILKSRKDPRADSIDANDDDISTAASNTSTRSKGSFFKRFRSSKGLQSKGGGEAAPQDNPLYLPKLMDIEVNDDGENMEPGTYKTSQSEDAYTDQSERDGSDQKKAALCCEGSNCVTM